MAYVLLSIVVIGLILLATENVNRINKAAVTIFVGVSCWMLYIAQGTSFVLSEHASDFLEYTASYGAKGSSVKDFIANHVFVRYVAQCAEIVLFLMATTTIAEVLNNNGCFDFVQRMLKALSPQRYLWLSTAIAFIVSANIDNLTTAIIVLSIIHPMLRDSKAKRIILSNTVIATCCGGAVTAIGDLTSVKLWNDALITPTTFFTMMIVPILVCQLTITTLLSRSLPLRLPYTESLPSFSDDDSTYFGWRQATMLFLGIGGLWFIPTFRRITLLPPFLGALCVLALLWFVNELFNHRLMRSNMMVRKRMPIAFQYANMQNLLYFIGLMLTFGALTEAGLMHRLLSFCTANGWETYSVNAVMAFASAIFGNVPALLGGISIFHDDAAITHMSQALACDGVFWPTLVYCTTIGGLALCTSSVAGSILTRMGQMTLGWYVRHITPKVVVGFATGCLTLWCVNMLAA